MASATTCSAYSLEPFPYVYSGQQDTEPPACSPHTRSTSLVSPRLRPTDTDTKSSTGNCTRSGHTTPPGVGALGDESSLQHSTDPSARRAHP